jgi:hypothetical protein
MGNKTGSGKREDMDGRKKSRLGAREAEKKSSSRQRTLESSSVLTEHSNCVTQRSISNVRSRGGQGQKEEKKSMNTSKEPLHKRSFKV